MSTELNPYQDNSHFYGCANANYFWTWMNSIEKKVVRGIEKCT